MKTNTFLLLFFAVFFVVACNSGAKQQEAQEKVWDELMVVHDEVMPKMGEVNRLAQELAAKAAALDSTQLDNKNALLAGAQALEQADEAMMTWMSEVQNPDKLKEAGKTHEEIMTYLAGEKSKVDKVKEAILSSLQQGEALLQQAGATTNQ